MDFKLVADLAHQLDADHLLRHRIERAEMFMPWNSVFQIDANRAGFDDLLNRRFQLPQVRRKTGFNISGHRHTHSAGDSADGLQHLRPGHTLSVGVAQGVGYGGAAGGDRGQAGLLHNPRTGGIPGINQHQRIASVVKFQKTRSFLRLHHKFGSQNWVSGFRY